MALRLLFDDSPPDEAVVPGHHATIREINTDIHESTQQFQGVVAANRAAVRSKQK